MNQNCRSPIRPLTLEPCPAPAGQTGLIHLAGGNPAAASAEVSFSTVDGTGTILPFQRATARLPRPLTGLGLARLGDCLVIPGGVVPGAGPIADVLISRITPGGDILAWESARPLPSPRGWHSVFTYQGQVCVSGGYAGGRNFDDLLCAPVNTSDCTLAAPWYTVAGPRFARGRYIHFAGVIDDRLMIAGGYVGTPRADVQLSRLRVVDWQLTLDSWLAQPALPIARLEAAGDCASGYCFLAGGATDANGLEVIDRVDAAALSGGHLSDWSLIGAVNHHRRAAAVFIHHHQLCLAGGVTSSGEHLSDIQCASIEGDPDSALGIRLAPFTVSGSLGFPRSSFGLAIGPVVGAATNPTASADSASPDAGVTAAATGATDAGSTRSAALPPGAELPGWVHVIGGGTNAVLVGDIDGAALNRWRSTLPLPRRLSEHGAVRSGRFIVVVGGVEPGAFVLRLTTIGRIGAGGEIESWSDSERLLPTPLRNHVVFLWGGAVCAAGGTSNLMIYCAPFDAVQGRLAGDWLRVEAPLLPVGLSASAAALTADRLWLIGGWDSGGPSGRVFATTLGRGSGIMATPWAEPLPFSAPRFEHALSATRTALYLTGGTDDGNGQHALTDTVIVHLDGDGRLAQVSPGPAFSPGRFEHTLNVYDRHLFMIGGHNGQTALRQVLTAGIEANDTLTVWQPAALLPVATSGHASVVGPRL